MSPPTPNKFNSLKTKIVIFLLVPIFLSGLGALTYSTVNLRNKLRDEAERYSIAITHMLARMSAVSQAVITDVEESLEKQMISQAKISAHMVATAEKAGESIGEIRQRLKSIVRDTDLDEFWITDSKGYSYLTSVDNVEFTFSPDPKEQPQAHIFYDLLRKDGPPHVTQKARVREIDNNIFKYVGTRGVDKNRIVQVGYDFAFMKELTDRIGLKRMIETIIEDKRISSIWIFDKKLWKDLERDKKQGAQQGPEKDIMRCSIIGYGSSTEAIEKKSHSPTPKEVATTTTDDSSAKGQPKKGEVETHPLCKNKDLKQYPLPPSWSQSQATIAAVLKSADHIEASLGANHLHVTAPILGPSGDTIGATLIHFPTVALRDLLNNTVKNALLLGGVALLLALFLAIVVGDKFSRPILALTTSARALYRGSLELQHTEPFTKRADELGVFVREFRRMALDIHQREEKLDGLVKERTAALESAQHQIRQEVDMASRFQKAILPITFPQHEHFQVQGYMQAAKEMGGDFYDIFAIDERRLGLVIADVSGKGVPSAFFMAVSRTELRNEGMSGDSPSTVLQRVNNRLCGENPLELFVTIFYAVLDHKKGALTYANGGHNPPYIVHADHTLKTLSSMGDLVVGMVEDIEFKEVTVDLKHQDILYLYTDGIPEAFNKSDEEFSNKRMEKVLTQADITSHSQSIQSMLAAVNQHVDNAPQSDDITCLALQYFEKPLNTKTLQLNT